MTDFTQGFFEALNQTLPNASKLLPKQEMLAILQATLRKMDLVTREEFDAQAAVLARTRARLELMEVQLQNLQEDEKALDGNTSTH